MSAREDDIVAAFVAMSGSLARGSDVTEMLTQLTADCARLLDVSAVGLLLADPRGALHVLAASSDRIADLEAFQAQRAQGPCHTCYLDGRPVDVPDLAAAAAQWPDFAEAAARAGVVSVHAVPMRLRDDVVGALNLFGSKPGSLNESDLRLAQALADVATVALIQDRAAADKELVNKQLQMALDSRVVLEQAKGVLSYSASMDMPAAYAALRTYARDHNIKLTDLSHALVSRALPADLVLDHARTRAAAEHQLSPRPGR